MFDQQIKSLINTYKWSKFRSKDEKLNRLKVIPQDQKWDQQIKSLGNRLKVRLTDQKFEQQIKI